LDSPLRGPKQAHAREAASSFHCTFAEKFDISVHTSHTDDWGTTIGGPNVIGDLDGLRRRPMQTWSSRRREPNAPESVCLNHGQLPPEWLGLTASSRLACEAHSLERDQAIAIAPLVKEDGIRNIELFGLPFGLRSAAIQFNRVPCVITACLHRLLLLMTSHYSDYSSQLELEQIAATTKTQVILFLARRHVQIGHDKRQHMLGVVKFLGTLADLTRIQSDDTIVLGPWPSTRRKTISLINDFLPCGRMTSSQASKMGGTVQWLYVDMMGRPCRGAL